jgi:predicted RNA-binding Zn-ribbon protein involved in translation (DUF1610 family)
MRRPVRSITIGTLIWSFLVFVLLLMTVPGIGNTRGSDFQTNFTASRTNGGWTLVQQEHVWGGSEINITALAYTARAAPWPLLLPLTQSRTCHIWVRSGSGVAIPAADQQVLEGLVAAHLANDPAWTGYPTNQGGRTTRVPWIQTTAAFLLWAALAALLVYLILRIDRSWKHPDPLLCSTCGYSTLALPTNVCPECGTENQTKSRRND